MHRIKKIGAAAALAAGDSRRDGVPRRGGRPPVDVRGAALRDDVQHRGLQLVRQPSQ